MCYSVLVLSAVKSRDGIVLSLWKLISAVPHLRAESEYKDTEREREVNRETQSNKMVKRPSDMFN